MTTTTRRPIPVERPARGRRKWPWITLAAIAVIAGVLLHSPWLSVGDIEIRGADQADVAGRVAATGVGEGAILVWVDTGAVADAVLADPWVRDVLVDRVWPDRLLVEVLEHRPALWVEGVRGWMLVSRDGTVLEPTGKKVRLKIATIARWENGRIAEEYLFWDNADWNRQIGLTP